MPNTFLSVSRGNIFIVIYKKNKAYCDTLHWKLSQSVATYFLCSVLHATHLLCTEIKKGESYRKMTNIPPFDEMGFRLSVLKKLILSLLEISNYWKAVHSFYSYLVLGSYILGSYIVLGSYPCSCQLLQLNKCSCIYWICF